MGIASSSLDSRNTIKRIESDIDLAVETIKSDLEQTEKAVTKGGKKSKDKVSKATKAVKDEVSKQGKDVKKRAHELSGKVVEEGHKLEHGVEDLINTTSKKVKPNINRAHTKASHEVSGEDGRILRQCSREGLIRGSVVGIPVGTALAYWAQSGEKKSLWKFLVFGAGGFIAGQILYMPKCSNRIVVHRAYGSE